MRITTQKAAEIMQCSVEFVRLSIQFNKIPGAFCYGKGSRKNYFVTYEQVINMMKGEDNAGMGKGSSVVR